MTENKSGRLPKRDELDSRYKWRLEDIYESNEKWEEDYKKVKQLSEKLGQYRGILGKSSENLLACLKASDEMFSLNDKIFVYARMKRDEDNSNPTYQAFTDRASALATEVFANASYIIPEITAIPERDLNSLVGSNKDLGIYRQMLKEIIRQKKHILSEREEELLALSTEVAHAPHDIFTMFNNADIKFPTIKDDNGEEVEVTKGRYIKLLESKDRRVREDAFHALYSSYKKVANTLGVTLISNVKKNRFYSIAKKYGSSLEASLDADNISTDVYDNLIKTVNNHLDLLHRYLRLRKKALKLDELHMYDLFVPLVEESKRNIPYEEALSMVEKGLEPMGQEYLGFLRQGFQSGWVDVYENQGKTSGAYSWGAYKTHPYVLLNYQGMTNDVFTIAHEMGHALHSFYTNRSQPYVYSEYKIFVAEVASTVNESLLMRKLLAETTNKQEKAYLLTHFLEEFRGTVFRQVMFAEFEKVIHEKLENGEALTAQSLSAIYRELNLKYFGGEAVVDEDIDMEWARIPHFYSSFYVYKYATGFSAATSLSQQILKEGKPAVDRYIQFLSSGSSDYPLELLKKAGVDLSTPKPVEDALKVFEEILTELEGIV